jgi:hypothetical protein
VLAWWVVRKLSVTQRTLVQELHKQVSQCIPTLKNQ